MVELETVATAEEADIASSRFNLSLPSSFWEGGQAELNARSNLHPSMRNLDLSRLDLPAPGTQMAEGSSLFTKAPSAVQVLVVFISFLISYPRMRTRLRSTQRQACA